MNDSAVTDQASGWMLLRAGQLHLLLPVGQVAAIQRLNETLQPTPEPGLFELPADASADATPRRVAALSEQLQPLTKIPANRFVVTALKQYPGILLAWDEARLLTGTVVQVQALPAVMCAPESPLLHFAEINAGVAFVTSIEQLLAHAFAAA